MPIELKINVNHATDLVAEVQSLASIMGVGGTDATVGQAVELAVGQMVHHATSGQATAQAEKSAPAGTAPEAKAEVKKTLTRKEQDEAVKEMIDAGAKDDRFEMLTKGRQNEVEEALTKPEPEAASTDLDDMFGEDEPAKVVTHKDVSDLMGAIAKDEAGNPIQDRLLKIRAILVENIPEDVIAAFTKENPGKNAIRAGNVPEDKLAAVYAEIEKIGE